MNSLHLIKGKIASLAKDSFYAIFEPDGCPVVAGNKQELGNYLLTNLQVNPCPATLKDLCTLLNNNDDHWFELYNGLIAEKISEFRVSIINNVI